MSADDSLLRVESSDPIDVERAKFRAAIKDERKTSLIYTFKVELDQPVDLVRYEATMKSISDLLLATQSLTRKWVSVYFLYELEFPFRDLEEHRKRVDIIEKEYEKLKSSILCPLQLVESRLRPSRWRTIRPQERPQESDKCSQSRQFRMEIPKKEQSMLDFPDDLAPEDAIERLEEVWTNNKLTKIRVENDLIYSKEFMDCLADIMVDYFPQKRFHEVRFSYNNFATWNNETNETTNRLIDKWIEHVANRIGVETKALVRNTFPSGGAFNNWNEDFTKEIWGKFGCRGACFDGTNQSDLCGMAGR